ncbi:hypothetical protein Esi_0226_0007 [Ectocarpus siliculosus]|uniref:Uncharacterized protein n=1 Tax=Ectocarpus siliculosus TaxID=2880 RepID=D7FRZ7_ECTSI|nr:hypothetical protein Esi_0226_0007 [Ectocarpus siliculosus]|eukprot:CBJ30938.1 hypothetical protein Esi_0226_0007 [Ectocarpus siliculosus]
MPATTATFTSTFKITTSATLAMRLASVNNGRTIPNKRMRNELDGDDLAFDLEANRPCKRHRIQYYTEAEEDLLVSILVQGYESAVKDSPCPQAEQQHQHTTPKDEALYAAMKEHEASTAALAARAKIYAQQVAAASEDLQKAIAEAREQEAIADKARANRHYRAMQYVGASAIYEGSQLYDEPCREQCKKRARQERKPMPFSDLQQASEDDIYELIWLQRQSHLQEARKNFEAEQKTLLTKKAERDQLAREHDKAETAASAALESLRKRMKQAEVDAFDSLLEFKQAYADTPCDSSRFNTLWAVCDVIDELVDGPSPQQSKSAGRRRTKRTRSSR